MASVKDFVPTPDELKGQKLGGEKMAETAFSKTPQPAAPKQSGGVTAKVSSFTPTAEELAAQQYDTVGAKGRQPGMQTLAAKERIVASGGAARPSTVAEVSAPELKASIQRGVEPMSKLQFATEKTPFEMEAYKGPVGINRIPENLRGAKPLAGLVGAEKQVESAKIGRTMGEKMAGGYQYQPAAEAPPTMGERMAGSAKYVPPKVDPYTGEVIKESASVGARAAEAGKGIISGFKGAAKSLLSPLASAAPVLDVLGAQQANEAALGRNVGRIATGQESSTGTIAQEAALQFMRDPTLAMKALQTAAGVKEATLPGSSESTLAKPTTPPTGQPLTTPATFVTGGAVDQAAPGAQKPQPKQFETTRVPESQTAVSTEPKAPSFTREQVEGMAEKGQAVSKGAGGNFRYVQGPDGKIIKQNTDSGEVVPMSVQGITGNILKPGEESPLAREARTRKETAFRDALVRQAFQPIDASTNVADVGTIKRNKAVAQQLLEQLDRSQQAGAQLGLEEKKLASTERATAATQEQNRIAKEADQRYKQERLGLEERKTKAAEEAAKSKPRTVIYKGEKLQGTPEDIDLGKQQLDTKIAGQWDKKNPKPSGLLATNDDVIKHYEKRAKELGYDPDVTSAANLAQRIQGTLQSMSPEDRDEVNRQFQSKYGVPYSEFIVSE